MNVILLIAAAAVELVSPRCGETVALLPSEQKEVMALPTYAERLKLLQSDRDGEKRLAKSTHWKKSVPVEFRWRPNGESKGPWELRVGRDRTLAHPDYVEYVGAKHPRDGDGNVRWVAFPRFNPMIATTYYWQVDGSEIRSFTTEDLAPRWIMLEGRTGNVRDLGGRRTADGRRVRQGFIYRGQGLNDNSVSGKRRGYYRLTAEDTYYMVETLGIRTDLDLRGDKEIADLTGSPLGPKVRFVHHSSVCYKSIFTPSGRKNMAENFRLFCDRANYPVYFHCIGGFDRTGSLAYMLNGVLGVARRELETDWEETAYPQLPEMEKDYSGEKYWRREQHFDEGIARYGTDADTWQRRIELYLLDCGITKEEIDAFRAIMVE